MGAVIRRRARLWIRDSADASMMMLADPVTLTAATAGTMAMQAAGGVLSASGTLAGGSYAAQAGQMQQTAANYQAAQLDQNATQAIASSQRQMLDTNLKTSLAESTSTANAAANGVNAGTGSAATNVGNLAARGSYMAAMDLWNGQSKATGLENEAQGVRYSGALAAIGGEEQESASKLAALGTLAGSAGSMFSTYGKGAYPTAKGPAGTQL
jgi:hypothetical protein